MPVNVELLQKVRRLIVEEPKRLKMAVWGRKVGQKDADPPPCGTVACLGGWIILASRPQEEWGDLLGYEESRIYHFARKEYPGEDEPVAAMAADLVGMSENDMPFFNFHWGAKEVVDWIDRVIAKAQ